MSKKQAKKIVFLRPSQAGYWMHCSGYIHSNSVPDPFEKNNAANLGTIVHNILDKIVSEIHEKNQWKKGFPIKLYEKLVNSDLLSHTEKILFDENKITVYQYALIGFTRIAEDILYLQKTFSNDDITVLTEEKYKYEGKHYKLEGTADVTIATTESLYIYDYKTGMMEVEAEDNKQLEAYAHLAALAYKNHYKEVHVTIIQPSTNSVNSDVIEIDPKYFYNIEEKVKTSEYNTGSHCSYCDIGDVCPALRAKIDEFCMVQLADGNDVDRLEVWSELLDIAPVITKLLDSVKEKSKEYLSRGIDIPGYEVYRKNIARKWIDGISPNEIAKALKLKRTEIVQESLKTPKAVQELIKESQLDTFNAFVINPTTPVLRKIKN